MKAKTKTFKIGEYAKGGVITVEVKGNQVTVIGKDWDMSKGTMKSSDQSNAREFTRLTVSATDSNSFRELDNFLSDLTTSYYTSQIIEYIETIVKLNRSAW